MKSKFNISDLEFEELENYLLENLSPEGMEKMAERVENDKMLSEKLHQVRLTLTGIREEGLKQHLRSHHKTNTFKSKSPMRKIFLGWMAGAAAAIVLIVLLFGVFTNKEQKLYAKYFYPDPGLISSMGTTDNYNFQLAMVEYKSGKYAEALDKWIHLRDGHESNDTLNYFIASAYLAQDQFAASVPYFEQVIKDEKSVFQSDAYWYLGLVYLKEGQREKAISLIQLSHNEKRNELLQKLK